MKISMLDQSILRQGGNAAEAINETIKLAKLGDRLGYTRFWVSEHHNMPMIGSASPEILMGKLAQETERIRIGAGGIMLPNHSSLKVAEVFRMLEVLYPGRIDLGLGRAPGTDPHTANFLNPSNTFREDLFPSKFNELQMFLSDSAITQQGPLIAVPQIKNIPQQWILTGGANAGLAAQSGLGLGLPHFIQPVGDPAPVLEYRKKFVPSASFESSQVALAVFVVVAETAEKAALLKKSMQITGAILRTTGRIVPVKSLQETKDYRFSPEELSVLEMEKDKIIAGTPEQVLKELEKWAERFDLDEVIASMFTHSFEDKKESFELLAGALGARKN